MLLPASAILPEIRPNCRACRPPANRADAACDRAAVGERGDHAEVLHAAAAAAARGSVSALNCPVVGQRRDRAVIVDPRDADGGAVLEAAAAAVSALNCPAVGEGRNLCGIRDPRAGRFAGCWLACWRRPGDGRVGRVAEHADRGPRHSTHPRRQLWPGLPVPRPPLIVPRLVSVAIAPAFDTPAPPAPPLVLPAPPAPPSINPLLIKAPNASRFDTPKPPAALMAPAAPLIAPRFVSFVIDLVTASTPSGPPEMISVFVTVIAPPLLTTGPTRGPEMI